MGLDGEGLEEEVCPWVRWVLWRQDEALHLLAMLMDILPAVVKIIMVLLQALEEAHQLQPMVGEVLHLVIMGGDPRQVHDIPLQTI